MTTITNNLRIIADNAASRSTLTASSTAGTLNAINLLTDIKSDVWRATGPTASLTLAWTDPELIGGAVLPHCNLTSAATMRVRGYTSAADAAPAIDTGWVAACAYAPLGSVEWGMFPLGANAWPFGASACARAWCQQAWCRKIIVDIADANNPAGYIEASRLVVGSYWSPVYNADYGAPLTMQDASAHYRNDAGDLMTDTGPRSTKLTLALSMMPNQDRARLMSILRNNGMPRAMFISVYPENIDPIREQDYSIYGKLPVIDAISTPYCGAYASTINIESV